MFVSFVAQADWKLDNDQSLVNFVSIKQSTIGEVNYFRSLSGTIKDNKANIKINLSSVETNIPIRNDRMKSMLFKVAKFEYAFITVDLDATKLEKMGLGDNFRENVSIALTLHGISKKIASDIQVFKLTNGRILVQSEYPIIINAEDFNLVSGIEALRTIAKLSTISTVVPVTFSLVFTKQVNTPK
jgi:polyisoprenoid-binding protein YceI